MKFGSFIIMAICALAFAGNAIAAEKFPRVLENINPAEIQRVTDEEAREIRGGPRKIPQRSFYNPVLRQIIILPGYNPRPEVKK